MSIIEQMQEITARHEKEWEDFKPTYIQGIREAANKVFEENPQYNYIVWVQYIPSFNDGDACEFSIGDAEAYETEEDFEEYNGDWKVTREVANIVGASYTLAEMAFGVHVKIIIQRGVEEFKIEDYDCGY